MYNPVNVTISGTSGGGPVNIKGAQVLVDATGKAADIKRRIQVRVPNQDIDLPDYVLASMDTLCKKFVLLPSNGALGGVSADYNGTETSAAAQTATQQACDPAQW